MKRDYSLEEAVDNHRKLWYEIHRILKEESDIEEYLDTVSNQTTYYPQRIKIRAMINIFDSDYRAGDIMNDCFLCQYRREESKGSCEFCPLDTNESNHCLNGLYKRFIRNIERGLYGKAAEIALKIAELPIINRTEE